MCIQQPNVVEVCILCPLASEHKLEYSTFNKAKTFKQCHTVLLRRKFYHFFSDNDATVLSPWDRQAVKSCFCTCDWTLIARCFIRYWARCSNENIFLRFYRSRNRFNMNPVQVPGLIVLFLEHIKLWEGGHRIRIWYFHSTVRNNFLFLHVSFLDQLQRLIQWCIENWGKNQTKIHQIELELES